MSDTPRRRRRAEQTRRAPNSQFPFLPLAVAIVLVGGFAIGAFFSHHRQSDDTVAKTSAITRKDVAPSQPSPTTAQPTPQATAARSLSSAAPQSAPASLPAAQRVRSADITTGSPRPPHTTVAATALRPTVAPTVPAPVSPSALPKPHPLPLPSGHRAGTPALQTPQGESGTAPVLSGPDHVVRAYLTALIRGDERTANTALGRGPDSGNSFPEQDFIDAKARITSLHATPRGDGGYTVETEVSGTKGLYFVTFQVNKTPDGYVIGDHSYIKP